MKNNRFSILKPYSKQGLLNISVKNYHEGSKRRNIIPLRSITPPVPLQELNIQMANQADGNPNIVEDDAIDDLGITKLSYYTPVAKKVKKKNKL